ncbi:6-hydroxycyclohex-1-ene-1-carbonyl-CoA dehydrogenase [Desulfospira joergensenii]|uniref:6-hydroxycyclohex-1-ene-1-carbonyl-CoA dehydrogenase n=1 Tax=Desulfospira joergensenii TaxID=53329 RepID=UPI0003B74469|nr:6-hydroxycyclohex-1-ene-1-carbonyl-CoA dehydrogenase [Desulfospira joergensenii]
MGNIPEKIWTWQMVSPFKKERETGEVFPGRLEKTRIDVPKLNPGEVLVEVAGCGICHTDLGYYYYGVPTVNQPPLTLGHEISGVVVDAAGDVSAWLGREVIVPAVMPCRECHLCKTGRGNRCLSQKMPGNSMGIYGGFSSHIPVPALDLCPVTDRGDISLEELAVVADAATTPFQAARRADVQTGDHTIVIGVGGVGQYMVQILKALGAATVIAVDINQERLDVMEKNGADFIVNSMGKTPREVSGEIKAFRKKKGLPNFGWKIFEVSGTRPGQELGLGLLSFTGKMVVVGFGPHKVEYSISRLMAFDAELIGTWGCLPEYYPSVLGMITSGRINFRDFVQTRPMSTIVESFEEAHTQSPDRRIVLVPDF